MRYLSLCLAFFLLHLLHAQDLAMAATSDKETEKLFKDGERAYQSGAYDKAIACFDQVLERDADHLNAYLQRGFCFNLKKEYLDAVADFSAVIARKPDHVWAYISRGSAYNRMDLHEKALADFEAVLAMDPKNQEAYNNRGWAKKAKGDQEGACADWKQSKRLGNSEAGIILQNNHCK
jgi:tetratricopeptide (TPR) repeat protein